MSTPPEKLTELFKAVMDTKPTWDVRLRSGPAVAWIWESTAGPLIVLLTSKDPTDPTRVQQRDLDGLLSEAVVRFEHPVYHLWRTRPATGSELGLALVNEADPTSTWPAWCSKQRRFVDIPVSEVSQSIAERRAKIRLDI